MQLVNRGVVIIKPKPPLLDWLNRDLNLSPPISMEELEHDCTALLVPELGTLEAVLDHLEPLKPFLFEMELESWSRDPATWPSDRTPARFDAWFALEVHSEIWDVVDAPVEKEGDAAPIDIAGTWHIVSSPDLDDDYLYMETTPYVTLRQGGTRVSGEFHVGLIVGCLDGRLEGDRVPFGFEATDEMDPVSGFGTMSPQGDRMVLKLAFYLGDEFTFECQPAGDVP